MARSNYISILFDARSCISKVNAYEDDSIIVKTLNNKLSSLRASTKSINNISCNTMIKHNNFTQIDSITYFKANEHIILSDRKACCLHVINEEKLKYHKKVNLNGQMGEIRGVCQISDKKQLCAVDGRHYCLYLIDTDYNLVKTHDLKEHANKRNTFFDSIDYNEINKKLYLADDGDEKSILIIDSELGTVLKQISINASSLRSLKVIEDRIYACIVEKNQNKRRIFIFNADLKFIESFAHSSFIDPYTIVKNLEYNSHYIYLLNAKGTYIHVFNINNYQYVRKVKTTRTAGDAILLKHKLYACNTHHVDAYAIDEKVSS